MSIIDFPGIGPIPDPAQRATPRPQRRETLMSYDYIRRTYGIEPEVGQPVRLKNYPPGKVAPEDPSQSNYVMVRFDGWDHDAPAHPNDLEYLPKPGETPTGFDEDHSISSRRRGRDGRSISHSYGGEGRNFID